MKFYGYSGCTTCRKALQWLAARDLHAQMLDITQTPPSLAELESTPELRTVVMESTHLYQLSVDVGANQK